MQQLHQVLVGRRAGRLDDEDVACAHVLAGSRRSTSPSEKRPTMPAELDAQLRGDLPRQRRIGVAGEQHGVEQHGGLSAARAMWQRLRHLGAPSSRRRRPGRERIWQGRKDSNPRMSESKSDALTNLATPLHRMAAAIHASTASTALSVGPAPQAGARQGSGTSARPSPAARPESRAAIALAGIAVWTDPGKDRAARPRHAAVAVTGLEPAGGLRHLGGMSFGGGLQIVATEGHRPRLRLRRPGRRPTHATNAFRRARNYNSGAVANEPAGGRRCLASPGRRRA